MNRVAVDFIQDGLNYHFKNIFLLQQAFTRKCYSAEHPDVQNNEVLEFYGDEILDFFVTHKLYEKYSKIIGKSFVSEKSEAELTKLKSIIVSKQSLAQCMYNFGFSDYLIMGKSDIQNDVKNSISANEDLFEAIVGAVAVDSNWNYYIMEQVCNTMIQMETINTFLTVLVKQKSHSLGFGEPVYHPRFWQVEDANDLLQLNFYHGNYGIGMNATSKNPKTDIHEFRIQIGEHKFVGYGTSTTQAKLDVDKKAYQFLCKEEIKRNFQNLDYENAVSTLHELLQKKVIMEVRYDFNEYHDENGNPIWNCKAILEGYEIFTADDPSKKHAKQLAARQLLEHIATVVIEEKTEEWEIPHFISGNFAHFPKEEREKWIKEFEEIIRRKHE